MESVLRTPYGGAKVGLARAGRWLAALPRARVLVPLAALQWLLALVVALAEGHRGSLAVVIPQVVVLLPVALVVVYEIALRLGGRLFAAWSAVVWLLLPYALLVYATPSLRTPYTQRFLPQLLGLDADPRFGAMVAFGAAFYLTLRALETGLAVDVMASVAAAGLGSALAPREALVAVVPAVGFALRGRWKHALFAAVAIAALLGAVAAAAGAGWLDGPVANVGLNDPLSALGSLRENFWSGKLMEWLAAAGIVGALRGRFTTGAILAAAFLAALLSVGHEHTLVADHLALLQNLLPAWIALTLLVASIPLLVPHARPSRVPASIALRRFWDRIHIPTFAPGGAAEDAHERPVAMPLWATVSIGFFFVVILFTGMWNATRAPVYGGYDAQAHIDYAYGLIHHLKFPSTANGGEYYQPPGYYIPAGIALWVGQLIGTFEPPHMALYLNAFYTLGTGFLLLILARLLFPKRPGLWVGALGFFAFLPIVAKTTGMFYPEVLNLLVSTAGLTLATWMLIRKRLGLRWLLLLGAVFGLGQLVRASNVFTFVSVAIAFLIAIAIRSYRQHLPLRQIAIALGILVVVTSPWYLRQAIKYHTAPLISVGDHSRLLNPTGNWLGVPLPYGKLSYSDVFDRPVAPFYPNEPIPLLYTEIWGDYFGYWAWANYSAGPSPDALPVLRQQSRIGILPTILAFVGWLALWGVAVRRRSAGVPIVPLLLLPLLAIGAVVYRGYATPNGEGDLLKASYALTTVPVWALGFGLACDWLSRRRLVALALASVLLAMGILSLRFNLYGIRDHFVIF